jgi:two-component system chemotaxis sensor kinase CheA
METENNYAMLNDPEMKEIVDSFIVETKEILEKLDLNLIELENRPDDTELLNEIFRSFHTIKGTSGFLGLDKLTQVTHRCEDILNKLRKGEALLDSALMDGILSAFDQIKELLATIETHLNEDVSVDETVEILNRLINKLENKGAEGAQNAENAAGEEIGAAEKTEIQKETSEVKVETKSAAVEEKSTAKEPAKNAGVPGTGKKSENTIRVDVDRLDELLNIASELVLGRNRLAQVNSEVALEYEGTKISRDLSDAAKQIDLMTNELQLVVMKTRMVKIGKVFNRYPRLVRDLARDTKKEVNLILKGEDTELDKTLIEEINDPLVHLIRNAVDHGIEPPEKRKAQGKDSVGTVILSAEQEGNQIIITIEDDGKGIDTEFLKEKAVSKGMLTKEKAKELSKQDAYNLIFLPGFSTAEKVTNVSGRGVGLDVVKTNVAKLRGIISIDSVVGKGTKMIVKLPLTLAIISGMIVEVKSEKVVIPLNSVIEVLRVHVEDIHSINNHEAIRRRDSIIPLVSIDNVLYGDKAEKDKSVWQYVVVIGLAEKRFGIKVDELLGQKEVVIKSLGNYLGNINGIAGSTIMGDGTVVMILDISELLNQIAE